MRFLKKEVFFAAFACAALFCGCAPRNTPVDEASRAGVLLAGNSADPESLDPALMSGLSEYKILSALFEGLVGADTKTLAIVPAAAQSWKISPDGKTYVFYIDPRARWSDGKPVLARDFVFAWRRAVSPQIAAQYASLLHCVKNAKKITAGEAPAESLGARADADRVLRVELERPCPYFLSMLYQSVFFPLREDVLKKINADKAPNAAWTKPANIVSNGAFKLEEWSINGKVRVVKNPHFRAADRVKLNAIEFLPITNINTEDRAFRAGQLHITDSVSPYRIAHIKKYSPQTLHSHKWLGVYYYVFNTARKPLDDPRVRLALSLAIDRRAIIDNFLKGGQYPAYSFVPEDCGGLRTKPPFESADVPRARALLAEAGYPGGKGFPEIQITYNVSEQHKPIAEAIQQMWLQNLGVKVGLYNMSWQAYLAARKTRDFDIARASWIGDFPEPETFLDMFASSNPLNHSSWKSPAYDALLARAQNASSNAGRLSLLSQAETLLLRGAPVMPIYFYARAYQILPSVKNWHSNILDYHNYLDVYIDPLPAKK